MQPLYAVIAAAIAYYVIQSWDDSRCQKSGKEIASIGKRAALFFFLLMVMLIGGHLIYNGLVDSKNMGGNQIPPNDIWKRIPEEVHVGPPPF
jgi:hypothetical protein